MSIPVKYLILEGLDCSGKTSLYASIHKTTQFKYNIQDRSFLSMLCYARLYKRDESEHRRQLIEEVCDANNFLVVLALPIEVILERYRSRGDDFQNEESLIKLHKIFDEEVTKLSKLPNVLVVREEFPLQTLTEYVASAVQMYTTASPSVIGYASDKWVSLHGRNETQFKVVFDVPVDHRDQMVMNDNKEGEYYFGIMKSCEDIIHAEISGDNPYNKPQDLDSRRFYYSSDTCISSIHFLMRDGTLRVVCGLRSTDSQRNGHIDLRFLSHLSAEIPRTFGWKPERILLDVRFNSLHIRSDLV